MIFQSSTQQLTRKGISDGFNAFAGPEHVVIDLTNRCNNTCIACWTRSPLLGKNMPDATWHRQELDITRALHLIDELHQSGTTIIRFTGGGEPFMYRGIYDLIRAVKSKGIFCSVTTNLNLINRDTADELIAAGIDEIAVSLWASTPEEYVKTHPNQSIHSFERITGVLKHIAGKKRIRRFTRPSNWFKKPLPQINLLNVICNLNYKSIEAMFDYAVAVGAQSIYYTVVDTIEGATDSLLLSVDQRKYAYKMCDKINIKNNQLHRNHKVFLDNFSGFKSRLKEAAADRGRYDEHTVNDIPCYIGWLFCRIMADGQVSPCCRGVNIPMGNINENRFNDIWYSRRYNTFRNKAKNLNKNDRYFQKIGCTKTCDNLMHNMEMHQLIAAEGR